MTRTSYLTAMQDLISVEVGCTPIPQAHAVQNARCRDFQSTAGPRKSRHNHSQSSSCDCQLRGDLAPVAQSANEGTGREFIGHDDFVARIQAQTLELAAREKSIHIIRGNHNSVRAQYESVVQ